MLQITDLNSSFTTNDRRKIKINKLVISVLIILNFIFTLLILLIISYGGFFILPKKINEFESLSSTFNKYGNDIDDFSTKFNDVYNIIKKICNETKICE